MAVYNSNTTTKSGDISVVSSQQENLYQKRKLKFREDRKRERLAEVYAKAGLTQP